MVKSCRPRLGEADGWHALQKVPGLCVRDDESNGYETWVLSWETYGKTMNTD